MTENRVEVFPQGRVHEQIARHRFAATSNPAVCWCGARTGNEVHSGLPWTPGDEWTDNPKAVLARDNLLIRQVFAAEAVTGVRWETDIVQKDGQWSMVAYPTDQRL